MIIKDRVYKFEIFYCDSEAHKSKTIYADSGDIYELEGVPQNAHHIYCYYKNLNENKDWKGEASYVIADEITKEDARAEIEKLDRLTNSEVKAFTVKTLKDYLNDEATPKIYLNKNIDINQSVGNRIIVTSWWQEGYIPISPKQIINGRIYRGENETIESKDKQEMDRDKPYIELE